MSSKTGCYELHGFETRGSADCLFLVEMSQCPVFLLQQNRAAGLSGPSANSARPLLPDTFRDADERSASQRVA
jgi:hypothetical protein